MQTHYDIVGAVSFFLGFAVACFGFYIWNKYASRIAERNLQAALDKYEPSSLDGCTCDVCTGDAKLNIMSGHAKFDPEDIKFWLAERTPEERADIESSLKEYAEYLARWEAVGAQVKP